MEDKEYEELYNKGFDEENIEVEEQEEDEELEIIEDEPEDDLEDLEQPDEETEDIDSTEDEEQDSEDEENIDDDTEDSSEAKSGRTIKWKGQEIFIGDDEVDTFIQKGFDYTKKTTDLAKWRQYIELIDENNLSIEDIATLNAAKNGNTDALGKIVNTAGVDINDINEYSDYEPQVAVKNYELEDVIETIKSDEVHSIKMDQYISMVPESTKELFIENPNILRGLYEDQRSGVAGEIMPEVIKALAINPNADFIDTYRTVGQKIYNNNGANSKPGSNAGKQASRDTKKKASISKRNKTRINDHRDVWEDDDLFQEMMRKTDPLYRNN